MLEFGARRPAQTARGGRRTWQPRPRRPCCLHGACRREARRCLMQTPLPRPAEVFFLQRVQRHARRRSVASPPSRRIGECVRATGAGRSVFRQEDERWAWRAALEPKASRHRPHPAGNGSRPCSALRSSASLQSVSCSRRTSGWHPRFWQKPTIRAPFGTSPSLQGAEVAWKEGLIRAPSARIPSATFTIAEDGIHRLHCADLLSCCYCLGTALW